MVSIWISGDIHGNPVRLSTDSFCEQKEFSGNKDENIVIISEYEAPNDFECIKEINTKTDIRNRSGKRENRVERLFKFKI